MQTRCYPFKGSVFVKNKNRHIYSITTLFECRRLQVMLLCIFSIVWPSILCSLQLFKPIENKMTIAQGKLKSIPIICIHAMYVTISIMV